MKDQMTTRNLSYSLLLLLISLTATQVSAGQMRLVSDFGSEHLGGQLRIDRATIINSIAENGSERRIEQTRIETQKRRRKVAEGGSDRSIKSKRRA